MSGNNQVFSARSSILAVVREDQEGELKAAAATDFLTIREGTSLIGSVESVESDELINDIGASRPFVTRQTPTGSVPSYLKPSNSEGVAPRWSLLLESCLGDVNANTTEYEVTDAFVGDDLNRAWVEVGVGEGANFRVGQGILVKGADGYEMRNVHAIVNDRMYLSFNLEHDPAAGTGLGKAVHWFPTVSGHPTFSAHHYQSSSTSAFHQAVAGCRTTSASMSFPVNQLSEINFEIEGTEYYYNPIEINSDNKWVDFDDVADSYSAAVSEGIYQSPIALAEAIQFAMRAAGSPDVIVSFSGKSGKYTFSIPGDSSFALDFYSGTNAANSIAATLGFNSSDLSGEDSYEGDNALDYTVSFSPSFEDSSPAVVQNNQLLFGHFARFDCRKGSNVEVSISTPKTDAEDFCSRSGVGASVINERAVTLSATLRLSRHEAETVDALLNNKAVPVCFNHGQRAGGQWKPGHCFNVYLPQASVTSSQVEIDDNLFVVNIEATAFVSASQTDIHVNQL